MYDILQIPNKTVKYMIELWKIESNLSLTTLSIFNDIYLMDKFLIISYKDKKNKIKQKLECLEMLLRLLNISELEIINKIKKNNSKKKKEIMTEEEMLIKEGVKNTNWKKELRLLKLLKDNKYYFEVYHPINYILSIKYINNYYY